ncbi:MAG: thiol reductant ABC exporter subunit CydD [Sulfobacillus sp.]
MYQRLIKEVRPVRWLLATVAGYGLASGILIVLEAGFLAQVVAAVYIHHASWQAIAPWIAILLAILLTRSVIAGLTETASLNLSTGVESSLRRRLLQKLANTGPLVWTEDHIGELVNTVIQGVDNLETFLARYLPQMVLTAMIPLIIGIKVIFTDWITAAILLVTVPLIPFFMILIGRQAQKETEKRWATLGRLGSHFLDIVQGLETLKIFGQSRQQETAIGMAAESFRKSTMATLRLAFLSGLVLELLASLSMAMVAVGIGLRLIGGHIGFEESFFLLVLVPDFYAPWRALGAKFHDGLNGLAAASRIFDMLDRPEWAKGTGRSIPVGDGPWPLSFESCSFRYRENAPYAVKAINLSIPPQSSLALAGPTGSGKTTLLSLLLGFVPATEGIVRVGNIPIGDLDRDWWHKQLAYVSQTPYLFAGTILDNLKLAEPDATPAHIEEAIARARFDEVISRLPQGLHTPIGENGVRLSGGERQRLALARVFLKNSPIVLLDEPSAHLDEVSEAWLTQTIDALCQTRTVILVAHRLSTLHAVSHVAVLDHGQLVDYGPPSVLRQRAGLFFDLDQAWSPAAKEALR